jgi:hypothetical protein
VAALATAGTVSAALWNSSSHPQSYDSRYQSNYRYRDARGGMVRANTPIDVRLDSRLSTDDAQQGTTWRGTVENDVRSRRGVVIPAGTPVEGVVTMSVQGTHDSQAQMGLAMQSVDLNGDRVGLNATTETIVAGSNRAKKIGAIAGGAAVGAIIGHGISHEHGGLIGGLLGGAAGYGATRHAFRTLTLKEGTVVTFTTTQDMYSARYR